MIKTDWKLSLAGLCAAALFVPALSIAQLYVYPSKGQSQSQMEQEKRECSQWASSSSGYQGATAYGPGGDIIRGAAKGAVIAGIAGGDAGTGAAAGALGGGLFGSIRHQQQDDAARNQYNRAYAACLEGRGYTVR